MSTFNKKYVPLYGSKFLNIDRNRRGTVFKKGRNRNARKSSISRTPNLRSKNSWCSRRKIGSARKACYNAMDDVECDGKC